MTTIDTITDEQIEDLRREAEEHDDHAQVAYCNVALGRRRAVREDADERPMLPAMRDRVRAIADLSREEARAECARVIAEAEAQS